MVLFAEDGHARPIAFVELSLRAYAEGCQSDNVAYVEGWYVAPEARGRGVGRARVLSNVSFSTAPPFCHPMGRHRFARH